MNEVLNRIHQSNLTSFFKDESQNKLMRHKKIYNLKLDYLTQYKPSLKSLRQNFQSESKKPKGHKSIFTNDSFDDPLTRTFIIHEQSTSSPIIEKKIFFSKSPNKNSNNSFHFFNLSNNDRRRVKNEQNLKKFKDFRVFSKNSLISPKNVFVESPKIDKNQLRHLKQVRNIKSFKHEPEMRKIEERPAVKVVPLMISPIRIDVHLKKISDGTIKGWDKFPSTDYFT
jgi:hypothetical protein